MWKTFDVSERVDVLFSRARREEIERHNEEVKQNEDVLRTLSEAVLCLAKQELFLLGAMIKCLAKFDSVFERRFHGRFADSEKGTFQENRLISQLNSIPGKRCDPCTARNLHYTIMLQLHVQSK